MELAGEILDQLAAWWEDEILPPVTVLRELLERLDEHATPGHVPTQHERAAAAVMIVATDLDALAEIIQSDQIGRDDITTWSTAYRSAVLGFGRRLPDRMYGELAIDLMGEAVTTARDRYVVEGRSDEVLAAVRSAMQIISDFPAPRPLSTDRSRFAALAVGHHELREHEQVIEHASRLLRSDQGWSDDDGLPWVLQWVAVPAIRSALELERPADALRIAESAESLARAHFGEVPGWLQITLLDAEMNVDTVNAGRLAIELLRSLQSRLPPTDETVLGVAHRALLCALLNGDGGDDMVSLISFWREVALSAGDSPAAAALLEAFVVEDENGVELRYSDIRPDMPDSPDELT